MAKWMKAVAEDEVAHQTGRTKEKKEIALFRLPDGIYALDDICSHEYSRLSKERSGTKTCTV